MNRSNDIQMFKFQENYEPQEIKQIKSIVPSVRVPNSFLRCGICFIWTRIRDFKQNGGDIKVNGGGMRDAESNPRDYGIQSENFGRDEGIEEP